MAEFGLSQTQMGTVFSAFLLGYTALQMPSGWLADRISTRHLFAIITIAWVVLTIATAAARPLGAFSAVVVLLVVRFLFGIFAAPTYPGTGHAVAQSFPPAQRARANGFIIGSVGIGSAVTPLFVVPLARDHGWRSGMLAVSGVAAVASVTWWLAAPSHSGRDVARYVSSSAGGNAFFTRSFWLLLVSYFLQSYLGFIFIFWFFTYLVQVRHFELLQAAWVTALPWVATLIAIPVGGIVSDAAVRHWGATLGRRAVPVTALIAGAIALVVGARVGSAAIAVGALTACTVLTLCTEGPFWATVSELAPARSGAAGGIMNFAGNLGGLISPTFTPWLAERIGWDGALTATAALAVLGGILWLGINVPEETSRTETPGT